MTDDGRTRRAGRSDERPPWPGERTDPRRGPADGGGRGAADPESVRSQFETLQDAHGHRRKPPERESAEAGGDDRSAAPEGDDGDESPGRLARLKAKLASFVPGRGGDSGSDDDGTGGSGAGGSGAGGDGTDGPGAHGADAGGANADKLDAFQSDAGAAGGRGRYRDAGDGSGRDGGGFTGFSQTPPHDRGGGGDGESAGGHGDDRGEDRPADGYGGDRRGGHGDRRDDRRGGRRDAGGGGRR